MKKTALLIAIVAGFNFAACSQPTTATLNDPSAPVMKFEQDTIKFGTVTQGTQVEKDFKFKNTGKSPLTITAATGSCHCTVGDYPKDPIAPGKTGVIKVHFDSNGKMGPQVKTVTLQSNNRDGVVVLYLIGDVSTAPQAPSPQPQGSGGVPANK